MEKSLVNVNELNVGVPALLKMAETTITKQSDVDTANDALDKINFAIKKLEEKRTSITQPINQSLRDINDIFKSVSKPLSDASDTLSGKVMSWRLAERQRIEKENKRLQDEVDARNKKIEDEQIRKLNIQKSHERRGHKTKQLSEAVYETAAPQLPDLEQSDSTRVRKDWAWEMVDSKKIPRKYLSIDTVAISKAVRTLKESCSITGIRVYQKEVRTNSRPF